MKLQGKIALVTGAGQGVGQGIAFALAKEGAKIAVTGRTFSKLENTVTEIQQRGGEAIAIECQVKSMDSLQSCVAKVVETYGSIDILVNNAQEVPLGELDNVEEDAFMAGLESGPMATFRLMKLCKPYLAKQGGSIINLATTSAKRWDINGFGAYAACKEAIRSLSRAAACEWASAGIRTNVIFPLAKSPGLAWWVENSPEEAETFIQSIPQQRIGDCEDDIGRFVAMLCSDDASYVNGQSIGVDGGQAFMG